jgi:hypothetical protein
VVRPGCHTEYAVDFPAFLVSIQAIRVRACSDGSCKYYQQSLVDSVLTSSHKKYIAGALNPHGDVLGLHRLLSAFPFFFVTGGDGIIRFAYPIAPTVELFSEMVHGVLLFISVPHNEMRIMIL